ncbi:MAG: LysM peptidoglycan-binding domain-containing protein [Candidatus Saccharimonadaceae bacterium]|nr:LysM peptidoglycan-binding domain-containing protein [Candidatus Saccharimonadaceae bacterium]
MIKKFDFKRYKSIIPYAAVGIITLALVSIGSIDKHSSEVSLSLDTFAANDYNVSTDQLTELYMVADLSDTLGLASAPDVASNYIITNTMYDSGQTATGKLEKPSITDIAVSRGVIEYTVEEGESMDTIAAKYGITTDDIRWSNNLKDTDVSPGTVLYIPSTSGIVYTVKADDTVESIAEKYGSSAAEIIALNDLEVSGVSEGMRIVVKDGSLPETERPEYEPPRPVVQQQPTTTYTYTYLGNSSVRQNIEVVGYFYNLGGTYGAGQCTQWAWYKRQDLPNQLGNANAWARSAAALGYRVDNVPSAGAVIQTSAGWYGHVGYVESVNPDGSIVVTEMNYGVPYRVIKSTIPASAVGGFNYIH